MAKRSGCLKKEPATCAAGGPSVRGGRPGLSQAAITSTEEPEMDVLLENALLGARLPESLTRREAEILKLIVAGNTNKEIAHEVYRTERTVEYHRHRLTRKLGVRNAADLVKRAIILQIA